MYLRVHFFIGQLLWLVAVLQGKTIQGIPGYGRNLIIKTIPEVEGIQSNLYEIYMEPYLYGLGQQSYPVVNRAEKQTGGRNAPGLQAIVYLKPDEESGVDGELIFTQLIPNGPVAIEGNVTGLAAGLHGVHIHQTGDIKDNCKNIGPHFHGYYGRHGGPRDPVRHVGDLGNIKAEEGANLEVRIIDHLISLTGPRSIIGRSIGISKGEDDYGRSSTEDSALTGTSGETIACGIIAYLH
ncbi:hypothetical protein K1T71_003700 [Dendrolimus kikuchii]|uniref:Uncharacterized protein n=1 Tax=Dendrolimus kikuchii TaxID=765133 RepID=A0ACC1D8S2_9NEOP|nr:hypothetical protein K1T71_003700 [Dendrolimus kikuchii]